MFTDVAVASVGAQRIAAWRVLNRWEGVPLDVLRTWARSARSKGLEAMAGIFDRHVVMYTCLDDLGVGRG